MTKLVWDQVGERLYETGVDRGVLYLSDGSAVPWNGLTSVNETAGDDVTTPVYFDGVKYQDVQSTGDFAATLTAFTYPDEFLEYEGVVDLGNGVFVDGQNSKVFGLSYRTMVANDVNGIDHGYKIHILYNLTATSSAVSYNTMSSVAEPIPFSWTLAGVPEDVDNFRPTAHVIFDSRVLNVGLLKAIEDLLYGRDDPYQTEGFLDGESASSAGDGFLDGGSTLFSGVDFVDGGLVPVSNINVLDGGIYSSSGVGLLDGGIYSSSGIGLLDGGPSALLPSPGGPSYLPTLRALMEFVYFWDPMYIIAQPVTGLSQIVSGVGDMTMTNVDGIFSALPNSKLLPSFVDGFYDLTI
jgi:hypothetical protein